MSASSEARLIAVRKWQSENREKARDASRRWKAKNPDWQRNYRAENVERERERARLYNRKVRGIPEATRPAPEACELCGGPPTGNSTRLHLDHDHVTGKFRGWLCGSCNLGLGKLGDSIAALRRAVNYLEREGVSLQ